MWCHCRLFCYLLAFGNCQANDLVTEHLLKTVISFVAFTMKEKRFLLFPKHLRLPYSIPKSFALLLALHCFRHSYAVIQISLGTDIYTVSKMLTHKNVTTTQIYADLVNSKKRETANKISLK